MASPETPGRRLRVWRSGDVYLVAVGEMARLVPTDGRPPYPPADLQGIVAHCNAYDPWVDVPPDSDSLPAPVAAVVRDREKWSPPDL